MPFFFVHDGGQVSLVLTATPAPPNATSAPPSDGSPYTWTGVSIGTAAADRYIVVAVPHVAASNINSVSVASVGCTKVVAASNSSSWADIWVTNTPVAVGTTANITVSGYTTFPRIACVVYALYGASNPLSPATATDTTAAYDAAITIPTNGAALAVFTSQATTSVSWTNMTANISANFNAGGAQYTYSTAQRSTAGSVTVTATPAAAGTAAFVAAAWGAA